MQFHFGWGSAHSASQTPYTDLRDLTSKGSGERGMEKGNGRGKKEKLKGMRGGMKDVGRLCHGFWGDGCPGIYLPYSSFLFFTVHFNYNDLSFFAKVIVKIKMKVAPYFVAHNAPHCTMNITHGMWFDKNYTLIEFTY